MRVPVLSAILAYAACVVGPPPMTPEERRAWALERAQHEQDACELGIYPEHLDDVALEEARNRDRKAYNDRVRGILMERSAALYRGERPPPAQVPPPPSGPGLYESRMMYDRDEFLRRCSAWRESGHITPASPPRD